MPTYIHEVYYSLKRFVHSTPPFEVYDEGYTFASLYVVKKRRFFGEDRIHIGSVSDEALEIKDSYYDEYIPLLSKIVDSFEKQSGKTVSIKRWKIA